MRATNYVKASYQEVYDVMTRDGYVSFLAFHTPTELGPYHMLHGFFSQYRKYKYGGMKVDIIPAAQLPADPLQVSYEGGESFIDPRDLQNPVLFHGAHGNNLGDVLNFIYSDRGPTVPTTAIDYYQAANSKDLSSAANDGGTLEEWYYSVMLDPSFRKFNVQSSMSLPFMSPRVHNVAVDLAVQPVGYNSTLQGDIRYPSAVGVSDDPNGVALENILPYTPDLASSSIMGVGNQTTMQIMTNKLQRLGWLDTFTMTHSESVANGNAMSVSTLPKLMMGVLILPPSYKTKLAFRIVITHYFHFCKFNTSITPAAVMPAALQTTAEKQFNENYYSFLPDAAATSVATTNSIDSINGDVRQSFAGTM